MNGKGDRPRNCFSEAYLSNYDQIFRKAKARKAVQRRSLDSSQDKHEKNTPAKRKTDQDVIFIQC